VTESYVSAIAEDLNEKDQYSKWESDRFIGSLHARMIINMDDPVCAVETECLLQGK